MRKFCFILSLALLIGGSGPLANGATPGKVAPEKVILDTDIGDDIDDAYALALLLHSPEVKVLGITTAFGDTHLRARLVSHLLTDSGYASIPVYAGPVTKVKNGPSQAAFAEQYPDRSYPDAIEFILETIRKNPGEVTLISIAPLTNVGALLRKDPATFRKLKRVVMMGGSIHRGYGDEGRGHPEPEWNMIGDIPAGQMLFQSGVPLYVMPLDSTQVYLDAARRKTLYARGSALTNDLQTLTGEWTAASHADTPTLYDVIATAYALEPDTCPMTTMRIDVDDKGMTREVAGQPNAHVCLHSDEKRFFDFFLPRVMR